MKQRLVFIGNIASPYQVKLCYALEEYFDAEFWFYEHLDQNRPDWWKIPLGDKCQVLKHSKWFPKIGYLSLGLIPELIRFKPDVILLGGFMAGHAVIVRIAKLFGIKTVVMSEPLRPLQNDDDPSDKLTNPEDNPYKTRLLHWMFKDADLYFGMGTVAVEQFKNQLGFDAEKVVHATYAQDIDAYFDHGLRRKQPGDTFKLLFANRLVERYQPLLVLEAYRNLSKRYSLELYLNHSGQQLEACKTYIAEHDLKNVHFLNEIRAWDEMPKVYEQADILILPATYSNGNGTIIEARASGMGVVISHQINNVSHHSVDGKNCYMCDVTVESIEQGIEQYLEHPERLIEHGMLSRELVKFHRNDVTAKGYYDTLRAKQIIS
ncbi:MULTISPECIES: glycosyltransferase family 4 protein [Exiguobacterium]|uniref:glycosyltransferase family 4 protein n=1 Tax=Exiguobacterium TaxID=33986 RepID=UPI001BECFB5A|nr:MULTISPECIES: glycosyltransferase family 4 protein [Exiguobacterium]MCT4777571.1 glycosyltransferase family 4 protein [Exiguobacterium aquaticum]MCT4789647.1 glycosyltransferase family 4 protein [Exiguobacterium mexicanum]